jgi:hypothetical protein
LPRELFVFDKWALERARKVFKEKEVKISQLEDPVIVELKSLLKDRIRCKSRMLYVSEPISKSGMTENNIIDNLVTEEMAFRKFANIARDKF